MFDYFFYKKVILLGAKFVWTKHLDVNISNASHYVKNCKYPCKNIIRNMLCYTLHNVLVNEYMYTLKCWGHTCMYTLIY